MIVSQIMHVVEVLLESCSTGATADERATTRVAKSRTTQASSCMLAPKEPSSTLAHLPGPLQARILGALFFFLIFLFSLSFGAPSTCLLTVFMSWPSVSRNAFYTLYRCTPTEEKLDVLYSDGPNDVFHSPVSMFLKSK